MSHLIGRRNGRETYPGRGAGALLASGGFAYISMSEASPFVASTPLQIPFDTIDEQSSGFGEIIDGGVLSQPGAFQLSASGIYFMQATLTLDVAGTSGSLQFSNTEELLGVTAFGAVAGFTVVGSLLLPTVPDAQDTISCILGMAGVSGNITAARMMIQKIN